MDPVLQQTLLQLVTDSRTNPDANVRRVAAAQAQMLLQGQAAVDPRGNVFRGGGPGRGQATPHPAGYQPRAEMPSPPSSMIHLDQIHPPIPGSYLQPLTPPSRILTVPAIPTVAPGTTSDPAKLDFTAAGGCDNGLLIGMIGCVRDDTPGVQSAGEYQYATLELQATFNDSENIITNGEAASFVAYCDLFSPGDREPFPLMREVSATDTMFFRWRNTQPAGTGNPLTPSLTFLFLRKDYPGLAR